MAKRTKKRDTAGEGNEEMIAGVPLRRVQEFLCRHEHSDWFDFDWVDARRLARDQDEPERSRTVARLAREMLARGWIEKVASSEGRMIAGKGRAKRCATLQADPGGTPLHGGVSTTLQVASRAKPDQAGASILWDWEGMVRLFEAPAPRAFPIEAEP
jgi:hypothetical protein